MKTRQAYHTQHVQYWFRRGLKRYFPLDGASVIDATGIANGTAVNGPTSAAGPSTNIPLATAFTAASSQKITIPSHYTVNLGAKRRGYTLAVWLYAETLPGTIMGLVCKDEGSPRRDYKLTIGADSKVAITLMDGTSIFGGITDPVAISAQTWYRYVIRAQPKANGDIRTEMWRNATLIGGSNDVVATDYGATDFNVILGQDIAAGAGSRYFNGRLAQVIWSERLWMPREIIRDYNNGQGVDYRRAA